MWDPDPRSPPDWIRHAYEVLAFHIEQRRGGVTRQRGRELLLEDDEFEADSADAKYALRYLLDHGWLYEVDDDLRVTDPER